MQAFCETPASPFRGNTTGKWNLHTHPPIVVHFAPPGIFLLPHLFDGETEWVSSSLNDLQAFISQARISRLVRGLQSTVSR